MTGTTFTPIFSCEARGHGTQWQHQPGVLEQKGKGVGEGTGEGRDSRYKRAAKDGAVRKRREGGRATHPFAEFVLVCAVFKVTETVVQLNATLPVGDVQLAGVDKSSHRCNASPSREEEDARASARRCPLLGAESFALHDAHLQLLPLAKVAHIASRAVVPLDDHLYDG